MFFSIRMSTVLLCWCVAFLLPTTPWIRHKNETVRRVQVEKEVIKEVTRSYIHTRNRYSNTALHSNSLTGLP